MTEQETHVVNNLGMELPASITELPGLRLTTVAPDGDVPEDLTADVLYTHTWGGPNVPELLTRGVRWIQVMGVGVDRFPFEALVDGQTLSLIHI